MGDVLTRAASMATMTISTTARATSTTGIGGPRTRHGNGLHDSGSNMLGNRLAVG
jgi:hypothetical protein